MSLGADPTFFILKYSTWLDAETFEDKILGALVKDYADPAGINYIPDSPLRHYKETNYVENTFDDLVIAKMQSSAYEATASIKSLGGVKLTGDKEAKIRLEGKIVRMKRLQKQPAFWDALKTDDLVKEQLPRWITLRTLRSPVCLVVGIMTCEDADVAYEGGRNREAELHGDIPVAQAAAPGGSVASDAGNLQAAVAVQDKVETTFSGRSASRKIFALELKVVTTPFFRKKKVELFKLKKGGPRAPEGRLLGEETRKGEGTRPVDIDDLILDDLMAFDDSDVDGVATDSL